MKLLHEGADKQAIHIEKKSGIRTVAATDLMTMQMGKNIRIRRHDSRH
jgi:hypothetical protein